MSNEKMNSADVFEMFETVKELAVQIKEKLMQAPSASVPTPTPIDSTAVKHEHRHILEIGSSKVFLSMVVMLITIMGLAFAIGNQRETISQYRNNDLKYRYVKMQGQTSEESFLRLDRQFRYRDSVTIIRKQVEKYEQLVMEQAERMERARREADEAEKLKKETEYLKKNR
ncbi:hypothetical protein FACS1894181_06890 [Bacteroidia bacterium]|nr:hypothetical protein FACS1894181_06890 [Bacteroidia bacterium]